MPKALRKLVRGIGKSGFNPDRLEFEIFELITDQLHLAQNASERCGRNSPSC